MIKELMYIALFLALAALVAIDGDINTSVPALFM